MSDLERAIENLSGHSIALCKRESVITHDGRGISPMIELIDNKTDLNGYSAADLIVGKAAALLFIKAGIAEVFAQVMSEAAAKELNDRHIPFKYDKLVKRIINRKGDGICPMEQTVEDIEDPEEAFLALKKKLAELKSK